MVNIDKIVQLIQNIDSGKIPKDSVDYYLQGLTDEELASYNQFRKDQAKCNCKNCDWEGDEPDPAAYSSEQEFEQNLKWFQEEQLHHGCEDDPQLELTW